MPAQRPAELIAEAAAVRHHILIERCCKLEFGLGPAMFGASAAISAVILAPPRRPGR
jgi:hypothetical protein